MRKIKFYSFIAIVGAMALSVSSCTKDLEDDVDQLKKDVAENKSAIAALDQAIKAGKLITDVKAVANGFDVTFSDGSKITINHGNQGPAGEDGKPGEDGNPGADGKPGEDGNPGADAFAPIIGIDSENYWTVVTSEGGTPERILVNGEPVKAVGTANVEVKDGFLWIDGAKTALGGLPTVVINEAQGTALISIWDAATSEYKMFTVLLDSKAFGIDMIRSIVVPYSTAAGYLEVKIVNGKASTSFIDGPFAGKVTKDQVFKSNGVLPVIVNPYNAVITKDMVSLVDAKEEVLPIEVLDVVRGFEGSFTRAAVPANGLWSIKLKATAFTPTTSDFIALKIKNGNDVVYTSYDYKVTTGNATAVTLSAFSGSRAIGKDIIFAANAAVITDGKTENLFNVDPTNIMFSDIKLHDDSKSYAKYIEFIKDANGNVTGVKAKDDGESHIALNDKDVKFVYTVVDYNGNSQNYNQSGNFTVVAATIATVKFLTLYDFDTYALGAIDYTILASPATKDVLADLDPLFNALGSARHAVWRENSTSLAVEIKDSEGSAATGIAAVITKVDETTTATNGTDFPRYIKFTFTNGTVLPGDYTATMTYTDSRNSGNVKKFTTTVKITVANPSDIADQLKVERVPAYFTGNNVVTYGTADVVTKVAQGVLDDTKLDLTKLYNNVTTPGYIFEIEPTHTLESLSTFKITTDDMYKSYTVKVYGTFAGNAANKIQVDEFVLTPKSEVKEGSLSGVTPAKPLAVTAGESNVKVKISESYIAKDVYGNDLKAFGLTANKDGRAATITVTKDLTDANRTLISDPVYDATDGWVISASSEIITMNSTDVKLNVVITDLFGQKLEKQITVTVKKKI